MSPGIPSLLIAALILPGTLSAQDRYERKSISYIDALWLATPAARRIEPDQVAYMLRVIRARLEMPRFDYNPLPEALIRDFVAAANARPSLTVDELAALMQQKLAPNIAALLREAIPERAGELVSESQRQTFIATKAKELGITLDEMEKVMNSAYIYLPVLTELKREEGKQRGRYVYTVSGGIIWFHVVTAGETPRVVLRVAKTTQSVGLGSDQFAYQSAVDNFARNLENATKEIPEFKLSAPIVEVDGRDITFPLGRKEGVKPDECFLVGEWVYDEAGTPKFTRNGWARVAVVADNRAAPKERSRAWAVKQNGWAPGMTVVEHPRLPIDIALKPNAGRLNITEGWIPVLLGDLYVTEEYNTFAPGFDLDAQYNLAGITGWRQTFFLVGGAFAFPATLEMELSGLAPASSSPPFVWGLNCGILKRYPHGQLGLALEGKFGLRYLTVEQTFNLLGNEHRYTIRNNTAGAQLGLGLDWASSPDFTVGFTAAYKFFPASDAWSVLVDGDEIALVTSDYFPDVNHSGPVLGLYMHYSPPTLPFDPISIIRGALGQ